jgi:hypothetical protein
MHMRRVVTDTAFYDITRRPSHSELCGSGVVIGVTQTCKCEPLGGWRRLTIHDSDERTRVYLTELRLCTHQTAA